MIFCDRCGTELIEFHTTCPRCKNPISEHIQTSETRINNKRRYQFEQIVDLAEHIWEELVDDPKSIKVDYSFTNVDGIIELSAPSDEIARILGKRRMNIKNTRAILFAIAKKYGFYLHIKIKKV